MTAGTFKRALALFPIREQQELDLAVQLLRQIPKKIADKADYRLRNAEKPNVFFPRARALLSYAMLTAAQDGWRADNLKAWGNHAIFNRKKLPKRALKVARKAYDLQFNGHNGDPAYDYDVRWAYAFANLCNGAFAIAEKELTQALADNQPGHGESKFKDLYLLAEAADLFVYFGRVPEARDLISTAIAEGTRKWGEVPEWFRWVEGWVGFAEAALAFDVKPKIEKLEQAQRSLWYMESGELDTPNDFDACALLAAVKLKLGELTKDGELTRSAKELWDQLVDAICTKRGADWDIDAELARTHFKPDNHEATKIRDYWESALQKLDD